MEGTKPPHVPGHLSLCSGHSKFQGTDPSNLSNMPSTFYDSEQYFQRSSFSDPQELSHFRTIVATFFNYKVQSV
jgi:hypothetical protein